MISLTPTVVFRAFVLLSPLLAIVAIVYSILAEPYLSQEWRDVLAWSGDGMIFGDFSEMDSLTVMQTVLLVGFFAFAAGIALLGLFNMIGLLFFWGPCRWINLALTIASYALYPGMGLSVSLPVEELLISLSTLCLGVVLAMSFFTPEVVARFRKSTPIPPPLPPADAVAS